MCSVVMFQQMQADSCELAERERMLKEYRSRLRGNLNTHNIKQYVRAFIKWVLVRYLYI